MLFDLYLLNIYTLNIIWRALSVTGREFYWLAGVVFGGTVVAILGRRSLILIIVRLLRMFFLCSMRWLFFVLDVGGKKVNNLVIAFECHALEDVDSFFLTLSFFVSSLWSCWLVHVIRHLSLSASASSISCQHVPLTFMRMSPTLLSKMAFRGCLISRESYSLKMCPIHFRWRTLIQTMMSPPLTSTCQLCTMFNKPKN